MLGKKEAKKQVDTARQNFDDYMEQYFTDFGDSDFDMDELDWADEDLPFS